MDRKICKFRKIISIAVCIVLLSGICLAERSDQEQQEALQKAMEDRISLYPLDLLNGNKKQKPLILMKERCLAIIYHENGARPFWVAGDGPGENAREILKRLENSYQEGLNPEDYKTDLLVSLWSSRKPDELAHLDTQLTFSLVKYIHDISHGRMELREKDPVLFAEAGDDYFDPLLAVAMARSAEDIGFFLDNLVPRHDTYRKLRDALAYYRTLVKEDNWPLIGDGQLIRPGMQDSRIAEIRRRLSLTENNIERVEAEDVYDEHLVAALKIFQEKHGLEPDGIIGARTRTALNRSPAELIKLLKGNMIRWHIQDHQLGDTFIMVNIAGFYLKAVRELKTELEMPVIIGKFQHQTPVFSDKIRYIEFNPYWNITPSIAGNEELPALKKNNRHLVDRHVRLFSSWLEDAEELDSTKIDWKMISRNKMAQFKLRQDPGPGNALGRVKFVFPNHHSVYLHDTPTHELFKQASRSFSHGCIRVSRPLDLAEFLLNGQGGWDKLMIDRTVAEGKRKIVTLHYPIPVHITYQTAWVDLEGLIHFNEDIYGRDIKLLQTFSEKE